MLTSKGFIEIFELFELKNSRLSLGNSVDLSLHKLVSMKYYQNICLTLWLDGTDERTDKFLDRRGCVLYGAKINKGIKRFIKFRYMNIRPNINFIFDWPGDDDEFVTIYNFKYGFMFNPQNNDDNLEYLIYKLLDVIINKNHEYFADKYKLK